MPIKVLQAPRIFILCINWQSLFIRSKGRKADQFGSIFIEQNKGFVSLAPAKALKNLIPSEILKMKAHIKNKSTF